MKPTLIISCPASSRSGYGDHTRDLIHSLIKMDKFKIQILDQRWGICSRDAMPEEFSKMVIPKLTMKPQVWVQITVPNEFQQVGEYNIGITAGMESDRVSPEWLEGANRMDLVIVPSEHSKKVFENSKYQGKDPKTNQSTHELELTTNIEVLFEGLDMSLFNKKVKACENLYSSLSTIPEKNCYLVVGHWLKGDFAHDRKDLGGTIRTFLETFKNKSAKNQPALVVKTSKTSYSLTDREAMLDRIRQIRDSIETSGHVPNVYLLHGDLTPEEMNGLYHHPKIKAMISFTHGEGFGRPLLEFGITGKPIMASNWSGHLDFLSEYGLLLQGQLHPVHESAQWEKVIIEGSNWYYVDYGYAMGVIKDVESNYKKHLVKSRKQKQYIKDNFTLDKMTELFTKQIETHVPSFEIELPKLEELQTYE
jgi:glycosyltransferase involved in cell wall biosynthesis